MGFQSKYAKPGGRITFYFFRVPQDVAERSFTTGVTQEFVNNGSKTKYLSFMVKVEELLGLSGTLCIL